MSFILHLAGNASCGISGLSKTLNELVTCRAWNQGLHKCYRFCKVGCSNGKKGVPMKKICVSVVGSGQLHEINIEPGTTAGDILRGLNIADYLLSRNPSADFFA